FYCAERKLVIEVDGKVHKYQKEKDYRRDLLLKEKGLKVLRIKNEELVDIKKVINSILDLL
ncbi:MAG: DUF559 domain-containing protein, partial [Bacteroidia bacterium]|nr:DUF559 domain-containing protein [Bacteroidia bacterium]